VTIAEIAAAFAGLIAIGFAVVAVIVYHRRKVHRTSNSMFTPLQSATGEPIKLPKDG
jgi:hypothetical protein